MRQLRGAAIAGAAVLALAGPAAAQHWIPPRPGQDTCSGWDTAEAQQKCRDKELEQQHQVEERQRQIAAQHEAVRAAFEAENKARAERAAREEAARQAAMGAEIDAGNKARIERATREEAARQAAMQSMQVGRHGTDCSSISAELARRGCYENEADQLRKSRILQEQQSRTEALQAVLQAQQEKIRREEEQKAEAARKIREAIEAQRVAAAEAYARAEAADEYKRVDVLDIEVLPSKFLGRKLKIGGMQCYAADKGDYRCTSDSMVAVFGSVIEPDRAMADLERECATVRTAMMRRCRRTVRFVLDDFEVGKTIAGDALIELKPKTIVME